MNDISSVVYKNHLMNENCLDNVYSSLYTTYVKYNTKNKDKKCLKCETETNYRWCSMKCFYIIG